jgi:hypothetical protein
MRTSDGAEHDENPPQSADCELARSLRDPYIGNQGDGIPPLTAEQFG